MAIVRKMERVSIDGGSFHKEVDCTYGVFTDDEGRQWLQIDTYGSKERKLLGKKSQSMRFAPGALAELRRILAEEMSSFRLEGS